MDFQLTEDQQDFRKHLRTFVDQEVVPGAAEADENEGFRYDLWEKMCDLGLPGLSIPEEYGGAGYRDPVFWQIMMEEMGRGCASTALSLGAHLFLCTNYIFQEANEELKNKYLPDLAAGKRFGGVAMTEPGAGSDTLSMRTVAVRKGDKFVVNGQKTWITNGPDRGIFVLCCKVDDPSKRAITLMLIDGEMPGFTVGKKLKKMGMRASSTSELFFEDMEVPVENVIGEIDKGTHIMMRELDVERVALSPISVGIGQASLEAALQYSQERETFGKPIGRHQLVQKMLAEMAVDVEAGRLLAFKAAVSMAQATGRFSRYASYAKLFCAKMSTRVALDAVQVFGGYGYSREYPVERYVRDAKLMEIGAGTNEIQTTIIAKSLLKDGLGD
jgi:acyl-CoA dehydrogenase